MSPTGAARSDQANRNSETDAVVQVEVVLAGWRSPNESPALSQRGLPRLLNKLHKGAETALNMKGRGQLEHDKPAVGSWPPRTPQVAQTTQQTNRLHRARAHAESPGHRGDQRQPVDAVSVGLRCA